MNIIASNGYFKKKQAEYKKSEIDVTKILMASIENDWTLGNIQHRDAIIATEIIDLLEKWDNDYSKANDKVPTPEQLAMIEEFKKHGWV